MVLLMQVSELNVFPLPKPDIIVIHLAAAASLKTH